MKTAALATLASLALVALLSAQRRTLEIWFIDVEGGQATLILTPAGESLLIDAGYSPKNLRGGGTAIPGGRDPSRIAATLKDAGLTRLDYLLVTHFHPDHAGGVPLLADQIPIDTFIDYGQPLGTPIGPDRLTAVSWADYEPVRAGGRHIVARPGDRLPLKGVDATIVSAGGDLIAQPLPGGGANGACADLEDHVEDGTENYRSIGVVFQFGAFRFYNPGDLSGNTLTRMACPTNLIGEVAVYLVSHHGDYDTSIPSLYAALKPRVAIMNNGLVKGANADALKVIRGERSVEDLWQLHRTQNEGSENAPEPFLVNVDDGTQTAHPLRLSASPDGTFEIRNTRNGFTKTYSPRR